MKRKFTFVYTRTKIEFVNLSVKADTLQEANEMANNYDYGSIDDSDFDEAEVTAEWGDLYCEDYQLRCKGCENKRCVCWGEFNDDLSIEIKFVAEATKQ